MKSDPDIDYSQRPPDYWNDRDVPAALLRNVKGTQRRRMITDYRSQGRLQELPDELLSEKLDAATREGLGKIHPAFMGGEYLPDYEADEVEIARIEMASTTGDVVSLRARRVKGGIAYRVVDEYDTAFTFKPRRSRQPLTLARIAGLIDTLEGAHDGQPFIRAVLGMNEEFGGEIDRDFMSVNSDFYPGLAGWWRERLEQYITESAKGKQS